MRPDGTCSSPEVVLESPMDAASTGAPSEKPEPRVNTRGLGRGRSRDSQPEATAAGHAFRESSSVLEKGNTESTIHPKATKERPSRAKKNYRPAQVVLDNSIQRRTSEQVKADQAKAKVEAAAVKAAAIAHQQSQRDSVAALEDVIQDGEYARSLEDLRPDLHIYRKSASNTDVDGLSDSHLTTPLDDPFTETSREPLTDFPLRISREPLTDLPVKHSLASIFRGSGQYEDPTTMPTAWERLENNAVVAEDNNELEVEELEQDYKMRSDNESETSESEASEASQDNWQTMPRKRKSGKRPKTKSKPERKVFYFICLSNILSEGLRCF